MEDCTFDKNFQASYGSEFCCLHLLSFSGQGLPLKPQIVTIHPLPGVDFTECSSAAARANIYAFWIPVIIVEFTLSSLAIFKAIQFVYRRPFKTFRSSSKDFLDVILRDAIAYFIISLQYFV
ncbi:hypothetical protein D9619_007544 [Psilocybe cf. subviscida]|uniref:Uncharacterized protein n=1 Tax=Psilocybe cf. subviscida TaxID=2480587 RepID=A0A8H5B3F2_9AGAR|nr:hypothetical protein D9619_007544 [Psilocybe cf. subviscida]